MYPMRRGTTTSIFFGLLLQGPRHGLARDDVLIVAADGWLRSWILVGYHRHDRGTPANESRMWGLGPHSQAMSAQ